MNVFQDGSRLYNDGTFVEKTDACLGVRFFLLPVLDESKSLETGIAKYKDIEMVEILIPGVKDITHIQATDAYKDRFKQQYEQFKNSMGEIKSGTSLGQFPFISPGERKELEYFNIYTAEQLISMPDGNIDRIPGDGRKLIKKVKAYMDMAKDTAAFGQVSEENENLKREMELLKQQMQQILTLKSEEMKNVYNKDDENAVQPKERGRGRGRPKVRISNINEPRTSYNA